MTDKHGDLCFRASGKYKGEKSNVFIYSGA